MRRLRPQDDVGHVALECLDFSCPNGLPSWVNLQINPKCEPWLSVPVIVEFGGLEAATPVASVGCVQPATSFKNNSRSGAQWAYGGSSAPPMARASGPIVSGSSWGRATPERLF